MKRYDELVEQAETAVAKVKDAELRRVAFEKVLDDLLGGSTTRESKPKRKAAGRAANRKAASTKPRKKRDGPHFYVTELVEEGFFKKPKTIAQVKAELENRGYHIALTSLSGPLQRLCQRRTLRRQKTKGEGKKQTFSYSNW